MLAAYGRGHLQTEKAKERTDGKIQKKERKKDLVKYLA